MSPAGAEATGSEARFRFQQQARSARLIILLAAIYLVLIAAYLFLDALWWLLALLALPTLPALSDLIRNPDAGLEIDATTFRWWSGRHRREVPLSEIDHIRMDTRWDFSVRVRLMLRSGRYLQLPHESLPHHRGLEQGLIARDLRVERHHFTVF
ncbi:hypothetical protein [Pseudodonghicola xiamenensis]|uniref:Uncharacterized protein n=1 Tax=Pseudodonghicola xiamenensis TaxID=337702 RepID=A0A8J3H8U3_9RHOB|nr:hypothetical protein [Pseudodonghicola xiamenensis]GHG90782.1 hypothetical protein GCM10010961_21710 [Pseudodonghicola xiamenensis]